MSTKTNGFGLIGLLITLAIIALASSATYSSFLKPKGGGTTPVEEGLSAINEAEKAKQLLEQKSLLNGEINKSTPIPPRGKGRSAIDNITLPNGEDVLFITDSTPQPGKVVKDRNCTIPEIQIVNAFLLYRDTEIPLGKIGIPKVIDNMWPPIIKNLVDTGLINENRTFRFSSLEHYGTNIIGVIDYTSLKQVVMPPINPRLEGKDGNLDIDKGCILDVKVKFFRLDSNFNTIKPDTYDPEEVLGIPSLERGPIEPGRTYPDNCSPVGCG